MFCSDVPHWGLGAAILPGLSPSEAVVDEFLDCLQLYTQGDEEQLKSRINEEAYYRNFVGLAGTLQPDGAKVNLVGFTTTHSGKFKQVSLRKQTAFETPPPTARDVIPEHGKKGTEDAELVQLRGELLIANATKKSAKQSGEIEIVTSGNVKVTVVVPPGMMSDIVKPLWESEVEVIGTHKGKKVQLMQFRPAS